MFTNCLHSLHIGFTMAWYDKDVPKRGTQNIHSNTYPPLFLKEPCQRLFFCVRKRKGFLLPLFYRRNTNFFHRKRPLSGSLSVLNCVFENRAYQPALCASTSSEIFPSLYSSMDSARISNAFFMFSGLILRGGCIRRTFSPREMISRPFS